MELVLFIFIGAQPAKTRTIHALPPPTDLHELHHFLGMCSYYSQLVPRFAHIAEPLFALSRKKVKWEWSTVQQDAFEQLKSILCSTEVMAYPNLNKP